MQAEYREVLAFRQSLSCSQRGVDLCESRIRTFSHFLSQSRQHFHATEYSISVYEIQKKHFTTSTSPLPTHTVSYIIRP